MKLSIPQLKKRDNSSLPQTNRLIGDIYKVFDFCNDVSFHFGCKNGNIANFAWEILVSDIPVQQFNILQLKEQIISIYSRRKLYSDCKFLNQFNLKLQIVVFCDSCDWNNDGNHICLVDVKIDSYDCLALISKFYSQKDFQKLILENNGINLTNKPLKYSTTSFEGYLSDICVTSSRRNDVSLFPGDVDLILYNDQYLQNCIIEFKKHTQSGEGNIEDQSFQKYLSYDKKKYEGLCQLAKKLDLKHFYNIIYSTKNNELNKIKIEKVSVGLELCSFEMISFTGVTDLKQKLQSYFKLKQKTNNNYLSR
ncbi:MAG: hypothetical protein LBV51_01155 [Acholeplasmatales bacterium]|nr:hypothetical protein [Acholeplasmatales bacterium]